MLYLSQAMVRARAPKFFFCVTELFPKERSVANEPGPWDVVEPSNLVPGSQCGAKELPSLFTGRLMC